MFSNTIVRLNLVYTAEPILDDAGSYQSPSGSSYLEGALFNLLMLMISFESTGCLSIAGMVMDVIDLPASKVFAH